MSNQLMTMAADLIAIGLLVFGIYFPRHRHRDMIVSYLGINVGVLAISAALSSMDVSIGTAVGLFGVLSIIRLRSDELDQRQVAYYFGASEQDDRADGAHRRGPLDGGSSSPLHPIPNP
ncbi:MAG: DUF4956 domain-containing protein [Thermomicrobiales bacterium]